MKGSVNLPRSHRARRGIFGLETDRRPPTAQPPDLQFIHPNPSPTTAGREVINETKKLGKIPANREREPGERPGAHSMAGTYLSSESQCLSGHLSGSLPWDGRMESFHKRDRGNGRKGLDEARGEGEGLAKDLGPISNHRPSPGGTRSTKPLHPSRHNIYNQPAVKDGAPSSPHPGPQGFS